MYLLQKAKQQVVRELKQAVGSGFVPNPDDLTNPPDATMGDIAFPCFGLSKSLKRNPLEVAQEIAAKIGPKEYIISVKAVGPYINFTFKTDIFGSELVKEILKQRQTYGTSNIGKEKRIMVEYANLNTHKDVHVGHLRNLFVGQMVVNVLCANGYEVVPTAYINDLGAHVAKSVWAIKMFHKDEKISKKDRMVFLRNVYIEATKYLEENPNAKEQVAKVFHRLEDQTGEEVVLWKKTRKWSLDFLEHVYDELDIKIEEWYFESKLIKRTKKEIEKLIKKGIVVQSEGAWIVDLQDQNLGVNLLVKTDGTLLYNAKDIALAMKKEDDHHPLRSLYVVDARQTHAMQQLFATMKKIGFKKELTHLSYDFVTLKDGAMASRKGNDIRYETFREQMITRAEDETRERHPDWKKKQIHETAEVIALSAMRFGMLKQDIEKTITFDLEESLVFEGFTGPYLLYTYARIQRLLEKATHGKKITTGKSFKTTCEHNLILILSSYPEVVFEVSQSLLLNHLSQYLFDLAKSFASFYEEVPILGGDPDLQSERLALVESVGQVLKNGLQLMGIDVIDEM